MIQQYPSTDEILIPQIDQSLHQPSVYTRTELNIDITEDDCQILKSTGRSLKKMLLQEKLKTCIYQDFVSFTELDIPKLFPHFERIFTPGSWGQNLYNDYYCCSYILGHCPHSRLFMPMSQKELQDAITSLLSNLGEDICRKSIEDILSYSMLTVVDRKCYLKQVPEIFKSEGFSLLNVNDYDYQHRNHYYYLYKSLLNAIQNSYYNLMHKSQLPKEFETLMWVLMPFANLRRRKEMVMLTFANKHFTSSVAQSFHNISPEHREYVYILMLIINGLIERIETSSRPEYEEAFDEDTHLNYACTPVDEKADCVIHLSSVTESYKLTLTQKDLYALWTEDDQSGVATYIEPKLNKIYEQYKAVYQTEWIQKIVNDSVVYPNTTDSELLKDRWAKLFYKELEILESDCRKGSENQPQCCFYNILYNHINANEPKPLKFDHIMMAEIITAIKNSDCRDQSGLYRKMFIFNYILSQTDIIYVINRLKIDQKDDDAVDNSQYVEEILDFLLPILNTEYINEKVLSVIDTKKLIKQILLGEGIIGKLNKETPKPRNENHRHKFNLALVYNILGCLTSCNKTTKDEKSRITGVIYLFNIRTAKEINKLLCKGKYLSNNDRYISQYNNYLESNKSKYCLINGTIAEEIKKKFNSACKKR